MNTQEQSPISIKPLPDVLDVPLEFGNVSQKMPESLWDENRKLKATINAIRGEIELLYNGAYLPSTRHVLLTLYPCDAIVEKYMEGTYNGKTA